MRTAELVFLEVGFILFGKCPEVAVETPYGAPSDKIAIAEIAGKRVAFLPRHGKQHQYPPHLINYRANLWAMKSLGVKQIIGPCAAGSLQPDVKPGEFVVIDQFVNRTWGGRTPFSKDRLQTFACRGTILRPDAKVASPAPNNWNHRPETGTVVVIQGPRFFNQIERWS